MAINQDFLFDSSKRSVETYQKLESKIFKILAQHLKINSKDIAEFKRLAKRNKKSFMKQINVLFKKHNIIFNEKMFKEINIMLKNGLKMTDNEVLKIDNSTEKWEPKDVKSIITQIATNKVINKSIQYIGKDMNLASTNTLKMLNKRYSKVVDEISMNVSKLNNNKLFISNLREQTIVSLEKVANKGLPTLIKNTINYNLVNYAEMTTRTNFKKAFLSTQEKRLKDYGIKLVISNVLADSSIICSPWQGGVYSVNGTSGKYQQKSNAESAGHTTHINCRHFWFPFVEKISVIPKKISAKTIKKNRNNRKKQRYNERQIRKWKRRQSVNNSQFNRKKVNFWDKIQKSHINNNNGMARQFEREEIFPTTIIKPKIETIIKDKIETIIKPNINVIKNKLNNNLKFFNQPKRDFTKLKNLKKDINHPEKHWSERTSAEFEKLPNNFDTSKLKANYASSGTSISKYWEGKDENGRFIIRQSDHWGSGIRSADWFLKGYPKKSSWNWKGGTKFGKIYLKDFKDITALKNKEYIDGLNKIIKTTTDDNLFKFKNIQKLLKDEDGNLIWGIRRDLTYIEDNFKKYQNTNSKFFKDGLKSKSLSIFYKEKFNSKEEIEQFRAFTKIYQKVRIL